MKIRSRSHSGFTLVELLVALAITAIIVAMLVTISATALTGYATSRNQVKAAREAKAATDQLAQDLESLVVRSGGNYDWLWVTSDNPPGSANNQSPNAARAVFFTAATDRYDGALNTSADLGGDVSTVGYRLLFRDPVSDNDGNAFSTFVLYRQLVNPDETFENLLASQDLEAAYSNYTTSESDSRNFLCENIYEFTLSFVVEYTENEVLTREKLLVVDSGGTDTISDFRVRGDGLVSDQNPDTAYSDGTVVAAEVSLTVINDNALEILRNANMQEGAMNDLIKKNSYHFSKTIPLPRS